MTCAARHRPSGARLLAACHRRGLVVTLPRIRRSLRGSGRQASSMPPAPSPARRRWPGALEARRPSPMSSSWPRSTPPSAGRVLPLAPMAMVRRAPSGAAALGIRRTAEPQAVIDAMTACASHAAGDPRRPARLRPPLFERRGAPSSRLAACRPCRAPRRPADGAAGDVADGPEIRRGTIGVTPR